VRYQGRCKGRNAELLDLYITLRNFTDSLLVPGFRSVLVKENLRFQFSPASELIRLASPAKPKVWRPFLPYCGNLAVGSHGS